MALTSGPFDKLGTDQVASYCVSKTRLYNNIIKKNQNDLDF